MNEKLSLSRRLPLRHTPVIEPGVPDVVVCIEASFWTHSTVVPTLIDRS